MNYEEKIQNLTIIGAAGKMGTGITLLTAIELNELKMQFPSLKFTINALDISATALDNLKEYLKTQLLKLAQKNIENLKVKLPNFTDNEQLCNHYVESVLSIINTTTDINITAQSALIFEVATENPDLKINLFKQIEKINANKPWYFTNTSSIPIHFLNKQAELEGRIVGFHFYNPPFIQKLVEIIPADKTLNEVKEFADTFAKRLKKVVVQSNDVAAFIGNGHFTRDILYASSEVDRLNNEMPCPYSIFLMNKISQEYLVRPMGIFQLIDYVGIDVCFNILKVMSQHITNEHLNCNLLNSMMDLGIKAGQNSDGSQKEGFFRYEKGRPIAIFDIENQKYVDLAEIEPFVNNYLGKKPDYFVTWKNVIASENKIIELESHFNELKKIGTRGSNLALSYGRKCKEIGLKLVSDKVSNSQNDVNIVMLTGFFHAYGPINTFFD